MLANALNEKDMHFMLFISTFLITVLANLCSGSRLLARNFTSIDGTRIYAEAVGSPLNRPLLWLHGDSFSGLVFDKQFHDPQLTESFFMVRMDLRGMGRSAKPANASNIEAWVPEKQAADVQAVINGFRLHKPILLGWSYGSKPLSLRYLSLVLMVYLSLFSRCSDHHSGLCFSAWS